MGIDQDAVEGFLANVEHFNRTVENHSLQSGFVLTGTLNPSYDQGKIQELWDQNSPDFVGYNCRITAFDLMKSFIYVENPASGDESQLFMDEEAIATSPRPLFSEIEKVKFKQLFAAIPTDLSKDVSLHLQKVKKARGELGIHFAKKSDLSPSLISVWMHSSFSPEETFVFIGHVGVLIPREDGTFYFIEKLAFQEPYQVIKFPTRQRVNDYLMAKYDNEHNQPTARAFIMENDELIEGYRINLNNPG